MRARRHRPSTVSGTPFERRTKSTTASCPCIRSLLDRSATTTARLLSGVCPEPLGPAQAGPEGIRPADSAGRRWARAGRRRLGRIRFRRAWLSARLSSWVRRGWGCRRSRPAFCCKASGDWATVGKHCCADGVRAGAGRRRGRRVAWGWALERVGSSGRRRVVPGRRSRRIGHCGSAIGGHPNSRPCRRQAASIVSRLWRVCQPDCQPFMREWAVF